MIFEQSGVIATEFIAKSCAGIITGNDLKTNLKSGIVLDYLKI